MARASLRSHPQRRSADFGRFIGERLAPALERADGSGIHLGDPEVIPIHDEYHR
jgi:hypothetical protein